MTAPSLDEIRDRHWDAVLSPLDDGWFGTRLRQLSAAAGETSLRTLFPYTSHNSLHFSRCPLFPFTDDCPWIWFAPESRLITFAPHSGRREAPPVLVDTDDVDAAVTAAVRALPPDHERVWVGNAGSRP